MPVREASSFTGMAQKEFGIFLWITVELPPGMRPIPEILIDRGGFCRKLEPCGAVFREWEIRCLEQVYIYKVYLNEMKIVLAGSIGRWILSPNPWK